MKHNKIGVFDSGVGGLTVLKELPAAVPGIDMVYFGDTARLPYGTKSSKTVIYYTLRCAGFLVSKGIDMLIVACNTASAHAIPALKAEFDIPIIGVIESGSRAAIAAGGSKIGVIGTSSTIKSKVYERTIHAIDPDIEVIAKACPLFVPMVEEGLFDDEITEMIAGRYLSELVAYGIDTLLLGCTHYPLLRGVISKIMGKDVKIVDSAGATASMVADMIAPSLVKGSKSDVNRSGDMIFYLTDLTQGFIDTGRLFLGQEMKHIYEVDLEI
ncbi:MAG: glutamate racemase [Thermodesulfobacteriota bacterium]|nr:glutamate racemase [Thermodesulfobacteriota bacterium]